jgi:exopolyphosphatase/guanosine-5'-triphosphate,3'-diphosphate pyrophosphatase
MKVAALDLGSNSFLLLIQEKLANGEILTLHDESVIVRLGEGLQSTQKISDAALFRAQECLAEFQKTIAKYKPERVQAVTTAAAREAQNSQRFLDLCNNLGLSVVTLSGDQEAHMSYLGAIGSDEVSRCLLVDIGGGSTESIVGEEGKILFSKSLSIGAVKMTEKFILNQPTLRDEIQQLQNFLGLQCGQTWEELKLLKPKKLIAVAGTPTAIAACEVGQFDAEKIEGMKLTLERLDFWIKEFSSLSVESKKQKYPLGKRADVILAGAIILYEYLKATELAEIIISTKGIRYGLAQTLFTHNH